MEKLEIELVRKLQQSSSTSFLLDARFDEWDFPVLLVKKDVSEYPVTVAYNGALDRMRSKDGRVFQRSKWAEEIRSHVVYLADPTLVRHKNLILGWGQMDRNHFAPEVYKLVLDRLRKDFDLVGPEKTLHFGSSAGGFQAICTGAFDQGSEVLVNNPQFDWLAYDLKTSVDKVCAVALGDPKHQRLLSQEPWRARVWELFAAQRYMPSITAYINVASHNDFRVQMPKFERAVSALEFLDTGWRSRINLYKDDIAGHSPMAKVPALKTINFALKLMR